MWCIEYDIILCRPKIREFNKAILLAKKTVLVPTISSYSSKISFEKKGIQVRFLTFLQLPFISH